MLLDIGFIYDITCPWSFLGKRRLDLALASLVGHVEAQLRFIPFRIDPGLPLQGVSYAEYVQTRYGASSPLGRIHHVLSELGKDVGIEFAFEVLKGMPNTLESHRLVLFAAERGCGDQALEALFVAHFCRGQDIGSFQVLVDLAYGLGLDADEVAVYLSGTQDRHTVSYSNRRVAELGVEAIPAYVLGSGILLSGAHDVVSLVRAMETAIACCPPMPSNA